ncbi:MAG: 1-acyl-sn-glycerol-3-phosphate acyltransferase [Clostridiales bacterium]|nr:1-acyl-sn-glycerol-3-phosphate acyltransferase [Clostridiales bacterium]
MIGLILVGVALLSFLIYTIPLIVAENRLAKLRPEKQRWHSLRIVQGELRMLLRLSGSKLTIIGRENIPDRAVLYVGNHSSYFDIVCGYVSVPAPTGFVAKKEMESWFSLAWWMRLVNCLFLDRRDIKAGLRTILDAVAKIKSGVSIWIFPEGTRNSNADLTDLLPFKDGSFKIAEKSGCPVIPVAITGTADIFERQFPFIHASQVTIEFGAPIDLKELPPEQKKHVGAYVREEIIEMLKKEQERRHS